MEMRVPDQRKIKLLKAPAFPNFYVLNHHEPTSSNQCLTSREVGVVVLRGTAPIRFPFFFFFVCLLVVTEDTEAYFRPQYELRGGGGSVKRLLQARLGSASPAVILLSTLTHAHEESIGAVRHSTANAVHGSS